MMGGGLSRNTICVYLGEKLLGYDLSMENQLINFRIMYLKLFWEQDILSMK